MTSSTDDDATLAGEAGRRLARFVGGGPLTLRLPDAEAAGEVVVLPATAVERLVDLLGTLAAESADSAELGVTGLALAADAWPAEDFSDWESTVG